MRFVAIKSEAQQAAAGLHKVRGLLVKQRTMVMNQLRGLMAEFGMVAAKGPSHVAELVTILADPAAADSGAAACRAWRDDQALGPLERRIAALDAQILEWGRGNARCRHLRTIPGFGPILSSALAAIVADPASFRSGRDFAASLGLVPRQAGGGRPEGKAAASSSSDRSASAATATCAGCWSTARWRC